VVIIFLPNAIIEKDMRHKGKKALISQEETTLIGTKIKCVALLSYTWLKASVS